MSEFDFLRFATACASYFLIGPVVWWKHQEQNAELADGPPLRGPGRPSASSAFCSWQRFVLGRIYKIVVSFGAFEQKSVCIGNCLPDEIISPRGAGLLLRGPPIQCGMAVWLDISKCRLFVASPFGAPGSKSRRHLDISTNGQNHWCHKIHFRNSETITSPY